MMLLYQNAKCRTDAGADHNRAVDVAKPKVVSISNFPSSSR